LLAVQAVLRELVSKPKFPVTREKTGNFSKNRRFWTINVAETRSGSARGVQIPYAQEQGIF
jgi:hypothetical protein